MDLKEMMQNPSHYLPAKVNRLDEAATDVEKLTLVYMWVKQGAILRKEFIALVTYIQQDTGFTY